jgi:hypothetical protein
MESLDWRAPGMSVRGCHGGNSEFHEYRVALPSGALGNVSATCISRYGDIIGSLVFRALTVRWRVFERHAETNALRRSGNTSYRGTRHRVGGVGTR